MKGKEVSAGPADVHGVNNFRVAAADHPALKIITHILQSIPDLSCSTRSGITRGSRDSPKAANRRQAVSASTSNGRSALERS